MRTSFCCLQGELGHSAIAHRATLVVCGADYVKDVYINLDNDTFISYVIVLERRYLQSLQYVPGRQFLSELERS